MTFEFRPAVRENVGLMIGLSGASGSGKTYTAMKLAAGLSGGKPFAVVDTENGRAMHYADQFKFDHAEIKAPYRPEFFAEAASDADAAGYPVIMMDSVSHEHAGDGGLLDWHEEELTRMAGDDWKKREACKMASWIKPKSGHKGMVSKLLQVRAHLILCFRAEEKTEMVKQDGKWVMVPKKTRTSRDGWVPICEKNLPYELTCSFLLTPDRPGYPLPIKLQEQHRALFPLDKPISEDTGRALAVWAKGGVLPSSAERTTATDAPQKPAEFRPSEIPENELEAERSLGRIAANKGARALTGWFRSMDQDLQKALQPFATSLKPIAAKADEQAGAAA